MPEGAVQQQREAFVALLESLGQASPAEIRKALAERGEAILEPGLDPEVLAHMRKRITDALESG